MKSAYPKIFEPITIKRTTIKNRIAMTPWEPTTVRQAVK